VEGEVVRRQGGDKGTGRKGDKDKMWGAKGCMGRREGGREAGREEGRMVKGERTRGKGGGIP
jgi:hypothetical protein